MQGTKLREDASRCLDNVSKAFTSLADRMTNFKKTIKYPKFPSKLNQFKIDKNMFKFTKKIVDKKRFYISLSAVFLFIVLVAYFYFSGIAYTMTINGEEVGKIRSPKQVDKAVLQLKQEFKELNQAEISFTSEITYKKTRAGSKELINQDALAEVLRKNMKYSVQTYCIYANGNKIAVLKSEADANKVLEEVKAYYLKGQKASDLKEVGFDEKIEIKKDFNPVADIMNKDDTVAFVIKGTNEVKTHTIVQGESFWSISRHYNMTVEALTAANPTANPEKIKIGQVLNLIVPKPLIGVKTVQTVTYTEKVPFEQTVETSSSLYLDETSIKVKGVYGEKEVVADLIKINGIETDRTILSQKTTKEPKTQVLLKGTKPLPPKKGTGTFTMPTRGFLSSKFGFRWGSRHEGIDIAAPIGTKVTAADGGVVIFVGVESGYGKFIKIDHGAGYVTCYGHLSQYSVKVGQKVYKGQKIGEVGNTGRSTGPHLHFEIRKNGNPKNPLQYVK